MRAGGTGGLPLLQERSEAPARRNQRGFPYWFPGRQHWSTGIFPHGGAGDTAPVWMGTAGLRSPTRCTSQLKAQLSSCRLLTFCLLMRSIPGTPCCCRWGVREEKAAPRVADEMQRPPRPQRFLQRSTRSSRAPLRAGSRLGAFLCALSRFPDRCYAKND